MAEVAFPSTRNTVGPDEYYLLDSFGDWSSECLRDKASEDVCSAARTIIDLDHGLELDLDITPYSLSSRFPKVDVDVAPVAHIQIGPYSSARHYDNYSAAITAVDGMPFDGYWCPLTDYSSCFRGPELNRGDLLTLLNGESATVTIYERDATPDNYTSVTQIEVDLAELPASLNRSRKFNAEIYGVNPEIHEEPVELCDLHIDGIQRRISYTYDEDFDIENTSFREDLWGIKGGGSCPSYVALAYLTPELTSAQRSIFCLAYDSKKDTITGIQQGEQDAYRVCKAPSRSMCQRVNAAKDAGIAIASFAAGSVGTAIGATTVTGTTVVMHSSGAAILTGSAGYVAGTLGTVGTSALGILTAPAAAPVAAISLVAVGGAVYLCSDSEAEE
ncbi:MAG TPA: hypothetical protein GXX24_07780 [Paracoccus solventivorans]|uniref:Uncharacterized protein n=1 Tax=Paracoccus solventivorans TaxID=53463 RepID=A0A832PN29_9RHOB|nr:hypothetical protein [Paracoccus solventivorans]HHW34025.1 hypothetical protein [Paracoccus solventivorans]